MNAVDPWKVWQAKMESDAMIERMHKEEADREAQEQFENSPQGRKMKELERRVEDAELKANMAIGIARAAQ